MTRLRILFFVFMVLVVGFVGYFTSMYARGYRWNGKSLTFSPSGLLVVNSEPKGAQIYINGALNTATDATINLAPGNYEVEVKKEGSLAWKKTLSLQKEVVTQVDIFLFPTAGSLTPVTFKGAMNPVISEDYSKIAYADSEGLWVWETFNLPIGFSRDPRQITDGNLTDSTWQFSPDGRQILLTTKTGKYILDTGKFTPQSQKVNIAATIDATMAEWQEKKVQSLNARLIRLPESLQFILKNKTSNVVFSPDENKVMYTASTSASLARDLIAELPGSSTQTEEREIKQGITYVYDIKEDRNFRVADEGQVAYWFPTSNHIILPQKDKILIEDYDGTNKQAVYSGSYQAPYAYPFTNSNRIVLLTNLGSNGSVANLYSLSLR